MKVLVQQPQQQLNKHHWQQQGCGIFVPCKTISDGSNRSAPKKISSIKWYLMTSKKPNSLIDPHDIKKLFGKDVYRIF